MLFRVIYYSHAQQDVNYRSLRQIMNQALKNNDLLEITGVLCFGDGYFLQVLEGERDHVNQVLRKIYRDTRHDDLCLIEAKDVDTRMFEHWQMKLVMLSEHPNQEIQKFYRKHLESKRFDPRLIHPEACLRFLDSLVHSYV